MAENSEQETIKKAVIDNSGNQHINSQNSLMDNSEKRILINRIIHSGGSENNEESGSEEVFVPSPGSEGCLEELIQERLELQMRGCDHR